MENSTLIETDGFVNKDMHEVDYYPLFFDAQKLVKYSLSDDKLDLYSNVFMAKDTPIEFPIILSIVILLSFIGNILVVLISVFCMRLRSLTIIFMLNLALSDLLFTVGLVFRVYKHIWGYLNLGDAACKVINFVSSAGFYSSIVFLVLMSVQRYIIIVHPLSAWKKGRWLTHILICAWMVSILASLPVTLHSVAHPDSRGCIYSNKTAFVAITYKENIVFLCTYFFMFFCYIRILKIIFKSPTNQRYRITGLTYVLVTTFFICWTPYNIVTFLHTLTYYPLTFSTQVLEPLYYTSYICPLLAFTRCCLNPVIYGLFGLIFRKTLQKIFQRRDALNSAQVAVGESHSGSCVHLNNE